MRTYWYLVRNSAAAHSCSEPTGTTTHRRLYNVYVPPTDRWAPTTEPGRHLSFLARNHPQARSKHVNISHARCERLGSLIPRSLSKDTWYQLVPKAHSYRRAFFPNFPKFGNNWRWVSTYGGVLSLFVKFSRSKNIKFVNIPIFGKKKNRKIWKIEKMREKKVENLEKKSSPIRMALSCSQNSRF